MIFFKQQLIFRLIKRYSFNFCKDSQILIHPWILKDQLYFLFFVVFESICNKDINCNKRVIYLFLLFLLRKSLQCSRSAPSCTSVPHYLCCVASLCNAYMTLIMKMILSVLSWVSIIPTHENLL